MGYVEGRNVIVEYRAAEGDYGKLAALLHDLLRRQVDLIAAMSLPAARAAKSAGVSMPIVFYVGGDPVKDGLVESMSRPGGKITGVTLFISRLGAKRLELVRDLLPTAERVGLLYNPGNPNAEVQLADLQEAAARTGHQILAEKVSTEPELSAGFARLAEQRAEALIIGADPLFAVLREKLIGLAASFSVPTIYYERVFTAAGGLMSYGNDISAAFRQVGNYVGRILSGARPSELPVQQATRFELVINLNTARALGLRVPDSLLARADEVIE